MALVAEQFTQPKGVFKVSQFPGQSLVDNLEAWILEAETLTEVELAQAAWVRYRGYKTIADRFHGDEAASRSLGRASKTWIQTQIEYWAKLAQEALDEFNRLTGKKRTGRSRIVHVRTGL